MANRCRYAEDWINESGPVDPPGARLLLKEHDLDLSALGRVRFALPVDAEIDPRWAAGMEEELPQEGTQILLELLDWALAAATRPAAPRYRWR